MGIIKDENMQYYFKDFSMINFEYSPMLIVPNSSKITQPINLEVEQIMNLANSIFYYIKDID